MDKSIYRYIDKLMSIFQKKFNISINVCQDLKKCQYFYKVMSIFQIHINMSLNLCPKHVLLGIIKKVGPSGRPFGAVARHGGG